MVIQIIHGAPCPRETEGVRTASRVVAPAILAAIVMILLGPPRAPAPSTSPAPLTSVNPLIGDESFFATFARWPSADDANELRVRTHLAYVERRLRAVDDANVSPALREARRRNLDLLRAYWQAGVFPAGENPAGRQPTFVDDDGRRCAVAALVEASAGTEAIAHINDRYRNAYIREMDDPALAAWIARSGFTPDEVAMIQPNYRGGHWPPRKEERWQVALDVEPFYWLRLNGAAGSEARHVPGIKSRFRLIDLKYAWLLGARAAGGNALEGNHAYYDADLHAGYVFSSESGLSLLFHGGGGIDGMTGVVPFGVTIPFGMAVALDTSYRRFNDHAVPFILQLRGEGKWAAWGPDRDHDLTWTVALDGVWRARNEYPWRFYAKDIIASVFATKFGDAVYGGVALGLGIWSVDEERRVPEDDPPYRSTLPAPYE